MKAFRFIRPTSVAEAVASLAENKGAIVKANGIDLLDRMKERVDEPTVVVGLVDVRGFNGIELLDDGGLRIGAGVTLAALAESGPVQRFLPNLAIAAGLAASPQLRHRATLGGNLGQHTRCGYYRHKSFPCLKRGGDHCPVRVEGGVQDTAAIFGNGICASAHPSSIAPVLGTHDAVLHVIGADGARELPFGSAWLDPQAGTAGDLALAPGELIEAIEFPARSTPQRTGYEEVRQMAAFDWALVSCAVRLSMDGPVVRDARVWLGSVAPSPWRVMKAEDVLRGKALTEERAAEAGEAAVVGATPLPGSRYKVQLGRVAVCRALAKAGEA